MLTDSVLHDSMLGRYDWGEWRARGFAHHAQLSYLACDFGRRDNSSIGSWPISLKSSWVGGVAMLTAHR
jgi:hypothetical protein